MHIVTAQAQQSPAHRQDNSTGTLGLLDELLLHLGQISQIQYGGMRERQSPAGAICPCDLTGMCNTVGHYINYINYSLFGGYEQVYLKLLY